MNGFNFLQSRRERRNLSKVIANAHEHAKSSLVILWSGDKNEMPVTIIDLNRIRGEQDIVSKTMGEIAHHATVALRACNEELNKIADEAEAGKAEDIAQSKEVDDVGPQD